MLQRSSEEKGRLTMGKILMGWSDERIGEISLPHQKIDDLNAGALGSHSLLNHME